MIMDWLSEVVFNGDISGYESLAYATSCVIAVISVAVALKACIHVFKIFIS